MLSGPCDYLVVAASELMKDDHCCEGIWRYLETFACNVHCVTVFDTGKSIS